MMIVIERGGAQNSCDSQMYRFTYGELEALLHEERELANAAALLAEHGLRARRANDDLGAHRRHAHLEAGVAVLAEVALHHLVQLGLEDTVGDELLIRLRRYEPNGARAYELHRRSVPRSAEEGERHAVRDSCMKLH